MCSRVPVCEVPDRAIPDFAPMTSGPSASPVLQIVDGLVGEAGLEPATTGLEGRCSVQLSYSPECAARSRCVGTWDAAAGVLDSILNEWSCRTDPLRVGRAGVYTPFTSFAWCSRWSAGNLDCDPREHDAKPNTSHEVTAARAGRPSGRTVFKQILKSFCDSGQSDGMISSILSPARRVAGWSRPRVSERSAVPCCLF